MVRKLPSDLSLFLPASDFHEILLRLGAVYMARHVFPSAPFPQEKMLIHPRVQSLAGQEGLGGFSGFCKQDWDLQGTMPLHI